MLLFACQGKQSGQWNLNKAIGWEPGSPSNYAILFLTLDSTLADSMVISRKKELDKAIIETLRQQNLGDQAENDEPTEADLHFLVPKNYERALNVILSVVKDYNLQQHIKVYRRDYDDSGKWTDKVVNPR